MIRRRMEDFCVGLAPAVVHRRNCHLNFVRVVGILGHCCTLAGSILRHQSIQLDEIVIRRNYLLIEPLLAFELEQLTGHHILKIPVVAGWIRLHRIRKGRQVVESTAVRRNCLHLIAELELPVQGTAGLHILILVGLTRLHSTPLRRKEPKGHHHNQKAPGMIVRHNFHLIAELERGTVGLHKILILVVGLIRPHRILHHRKEPEQVEAVNCHSRKNPVMIDRHNFRLIAELEQESAVHRILMILVAG